MYYSHQTREGNKPIRQSSSRLASNSDVSAQQQAPPPKPPDYGEVGAANYIAAKGIRRGNRRGSMRETDYHSSSIVTFIRTKKADIVKEMLNISNKIGDPILTETITHGATTLANDDTYFTAILTDLFENGNCGEFAALILKYLNRYAPGRAVYTVSMPSYS